MPAPKNNQFWKIRATSGRGKIFDNPDQLWKAACKYFKWTEENPWYRGEAVKSGDLTGLIIQVPVARPMTVEGLCIFLNIQTKTFNYYASGDESYKDFLPIAMRIKEIIRTQKFEGAAVGVFNASIISRDLGLRDSQDITTAGEKINKLEFTVDNSDTFKELQKLRNGSKAD